MDQPGDNAYKRGSASKWSKSRKADYDKKGGNKKSKKGKQFQDKPRDYTVTDKPETILDADGNPIKRKPKRKVAVMIGYCGTGYHGMQINPPAKTIEGDLYAAFVKAGAVSQYNADDPKKSGFMRAARTDKGVHAAGNLISLKMTVEDEDVVEKINSHLPPTIRIWGIERTNKAFDCRKMCGSRVYEYLIPTYSFIAPKPSSVLAERITEADAEFPGQTREDPESAAFWSGFDQLIKDAQFTEEELQIIRDFKPLGPEEYDDSVPGVRLSKKYKAIENKHKRAYRISNEKLDLMRSAMNHYLGHHNFHNFTLGKPFTDASAGRFMKNITVSEPFVIDGTEWASIKIHGQSFMLHQIRKMIAMATLVVRTGCPLDRIKEAFQKDKINIPKAPALGLLLEQPVYTGYNAKLEDFGYKPIDFRTYATEMDAFKMKHIYDKIYAEEIKDNVFNSFFNFIDSHSGDRIFDFLTAKGITPLSKDELREVAIPNEKETSEEIDEEDEDKPKGKKQQQQQQQKRQQQQQQQESTPITNESTPVVETEIKAEAEKPAAKGRTCTIV